jgi:hypothetical protein
MIANAADATVTVTAAPMDAGAAGTPDLATAAPADLATRAESDAALTPPYDAGATGHRGGCGCTVSAGDSPSSSHTAALLVAGPERRNR